MKSKYTHLVTHLIYGLALCFNQSVEASSLPIDLKGNPNVTLIGNGLGSRMQLFGFFETSLYSAQPAANIRFRNLCDDGNTAGFRPHSARDNPFAFEGAQSFHPPLSEQKDRWGSGHTGKGNFKSPDSWLTELKTDTLIAFFGYNEAFSGEAGLANFKEEVSAFLKHTKSQRYNGKSAPEIVLVSPIAFDSSTQPSAYIDSASYNKNLELYTKALKEVSENEKVAFIDIFAPSKKWFQSAPKTLTLNGFHLNKDGYKKLSQELSSRLTGQNIKLDSTTTKKIHDAVLDKNWLWSNYYKIPNGVHVFGRRHRPFGPKNYPFELQKLKEMLDNRDQAITALAQKKRFDLKAADARTSPLPEVKTNFKTSRKNGSKTYLYGEDALKKFSLPEGFKIELFASEKEFPNLANPCQMSFDSKGRLWVSTMPSYPHYKVTDEKPNDKILIYEDSNNDGKADKEIVFADQLQLPTGFEITHKGVYVSQGSNLLLLEDTDNDDKADKRTVILSGFDDHDTHHAISSFSQDPFGNILMSEGTFLHSNVETAYGVQRSSNGGFWRFSPNTQKLDRLARISIPNPWGITFNGWGQGLFLDTSDPNARWLTPASIKVPYGYFAPLPANLVEKNQRVRPTSGLEFVSSRHFPNNMQGDYLLNNVIGFRGTKQHTLEDGSVGFTSKHRQDLVSSDDTNYRPVDLEFAPDGSLFIVDWHNVLIGHMQHSARDPLRDHKHGRIYRVTHKSLPLVTPPKIDGATIAQLLENLKLPEYRARYRTRTELRKFESTKVNSALMSWQKKLKTNDSKYDNYLLEALLVTFSSDHPNLEIHKLSIESNNFNLRCVAVRALAQTPLAFNNLQEILNKAAKDPHGRVRLEALVVASQLSNRIDLNAILGQLPNDEINKDAQLSPVITTLRTLASNQTITSKEEKINVPKHLKGNDIARFVKGHEVYHREAHCATCHQEDGEGLPAAMFPPLTRTKWVLEDQERLIKLVIHGLHGPITIKGKQYPGLVPMSAFKALTDQEIADVLTFVRNSFGNKASSVSPALVKKVRADTSDQEGFFAPEELLKQHPHKK